MTQHNHNEFTKSELISRWVLSVFLEIYIDESAGYKGHNAQNNKHPIFTQTVYPYNNNYLTIQVFNRVRK